MMTMMMTDDKYYDDDDDDKNIMMIIRFIILKFHRSYLQTRKIHIFKHGSIADYLAQIISDFLFREPPPSQSLFPAATWISSESAQDDFSNVGNVHKGHHGGEIFPDQLNSSNC